MYPLLSLPFFSAYHKQSIANPKQKKRSTPPPTPGQRKLPSGQTRLQRSQNEITWYNTTKSVIVITFTSQQQQFPFTSQFEYTTRSVGRCQCRQQRLCYLRQWQGFCGKITENLFGPPFRTQFTRVLQTHRQLLGRRLPVCAQRPDYQCFTTFAPRSNNTGHVQFQYAHTVEWLCEIFSDFF